MRTGRHDLNVKFLSHSQRATGPCRPGVGDGSIVLKFYFLKYKNEKSAWPRAGGVAVVPGAGRRGPDAAGRGSRGLGAVSRPASECAPGWKALPCRVGRGFSDGFARGEGEYWSCLVL